MSKKIFLILIFCTAAAGAIFALYPELDLQISTLFYDRLSGTFGAASNPVLVWIRREGTLVASCLAICIFALLAANVILRANSAVFSRRAAIYLLLVFGLAPGLIVSRVVKEYSHRPRPAAVEPFGGKQKFVAWWDRSGSCSRDCSFASSETATVALAHGRRRAAAGPLADTGHCPVARFHGGDRPAPHFVRRAFLFRRCVRRADHVVDGMDSLSSHL